MTSADATDPEDPLFARVCAALVEIGLEPSRLTPDAHLSDDLELDSLDRVDLVQRLEEDLGIDLQEERLGSLATLADVVALLRR